MNSFSKNKILDLSKLKAIEDSRFSFLNGFVFNRLESIVGKGENGGYFISSFSPQSFENILFQS